MFSMSSKSKKQPSTLQNSRHKGRESPFSKTRIATELNAEGLVPQNDLNGLDLLLPPISRCRTYAPKEARVIVPHIPHRCAHRQPGRNTARSRLLTKSLPEIASSDGGRFASLSL